MRNIMKSFAAAAFIAVAAHSTFAHASAEVSDRCNTTGAIAAQVMSMRIQGVSKTVLRNALIETGKQTVRSMQLIDAVLDDVYDDPNTDVEHAYVVARRSCLEGIGAARGE